MPCYLFTYHAYGTWLPDRPQGYVKRRRGILPRDAKMADLYRREMKEAIGSFDERVQRCLLEATCASAEPQRFECYAAASDPTHLNLLLGWRDDRCVVTLRALVKGPCRDS